MAEASVAHRSDMMIGRREARTDGDTSKVSVESSTPPNGSVRMAVTSSSLASCGSTRSTVWRLSWVPAAVVSVKLPSCLTGGLGAGHRGGSSPD